MLLQIFTVYDSKAEAFITPFFMQNIPTAVRVFGDMVNSHDHAFAKHPEDYTLYHLGSYDDDNGNFNLMESKSSLGVGIQFVTHDKDPRQLDLVDQHKDYEESPANLKEQAQ